MGIMNRRNAVLGWAVWQVMKRWRSRRRSGRAEGRRAKRRPTSGDRRRARRGAARLCSLAEEELGRRLAAGRVSAAPFFRRSIADLVPYEPGKPVEEVQRELGLERVVKLASNEGPFGPFPAALEALERQARELNRYPDGGAYALRAALAERHGVAFEEVAIGAGADGVIDCLSQAALDDGDEIVCGWPSFPSYVIDALQARRAPGARAAARPPLRPRRAPRRDHGRGRSSSTSATRTTRPARRTRATSWTRSSTASPSTC